jgi:hypothetical protein
MNKKYFLKGINFGLGFTFILTCLALVFGVGFHTPNEILSGTFLGNFTFNNNLEIKGEFRAKNIPTAWVNFDGTNCPSNYCNIFDSYNVKNVLKLSTGNYEIYFKNNLSNSNYAVGGSAGGSGSINRIISQGTKNINKVNVKIYATSNTIYDDHGSVIIYGGQN